MSAQVGDEQHALYRFWGQDGVLLYVGITNDPKRRTREHSSDKPWWRDAAVMTIERFPTRSAVETAERLAIIMERPVHNIIYSSDGRSHWASVEAASWTAGFDDLLAPRSVRRERERRYQRTRLAALTVFACAAPSWTAAALCNDLAPGRMAGGVGAALTVAVYLAFGCYTILRLRVRRLAPFASMTAAAQ